MMIRRWMTLILLCFMVLGASADKQAKEKGEAIYNRMVEYSLRGNDVQLQKEKETALAYFYNHEQWEHYYYVATLCMMSKVMNEGQAMAGLRECRRLYELARERQHDYGRGLVMAQMAWLYGYIGDHDASLRQMREAFSVLRRHPISRETIGLVYYYAYALELTGNYEEEARMLSVVKPMIRTFEWGDTTSLFYRTYRDNLLNAEALLEVRRGQLTRAGQLVNRLHAKIATGDEQNEYEALRAIAENARQEQFGDDHLLEVMRHQPFTTAHELVDTMTILVEGHRQGTDPNDDLTMFCLQYQ